MECRAAGTCSLQPPSCCDEVWVEASVCLAASRFVDGSTRLRFGVHGSWFSVSGSADC